MILPVCVLPASALEVAAEVFSTSSAPPGNGHPKGRQPKEQRRKRQHGQGEQQHSLIWSKARFNERPLPQHARRQLGKTPRQRAGHDHQQQTLGEQLAQQLAAPHAQRQPQRELSLPGGIAGHQQHHYIGERNQQHQANHGHQHAQRLAVHPVIPGKVFGICEAQHRRLLPRHRRTQANIGRRLKYLLQTQDCLLAAYSGSQPPHELQAPPCRVLLIEFAFFRGIAQHIELDAILQRDPEVHGVARFCAFKTFRGYAYNGEGNALHIQCLPQHIRIAREAAGPVAVADHHGLCVVSLFLGSESASASQLHAQRAEKIPTHHVGFRRLRLRADAHIHFVRR